MVANPALETKRGSHLPIKLGTLPDFTPPTIDGNSHDHGISIPDARLTEVYSDRFPKNPADHAGRNEPFDYEISQERVNAFIEIIGGDVNKKSHQTLARVMLAQAGLSAYYAEMGGQNFTTIFSKHVIYVDAIPAAGTLETSIAIAPDPRVKGDTLRLITAYEQKQKNIPIITGASTLFFAPYPRVGDIKPTTLREENYDGFEDCAESHIITGEQIDAFARVSGDKNKAHTDDEYMEQSVFGGKRISHGILASSIALRELIDSLEVRLGYPIMISTADLLFCNVIRADDTEIQTKVNITSDYNCKMAVVDKTGHAIILGNINFQRLVEEKAA